jgi:hypothetical protein
MGSAARPSRGRRIGVVPATSSLNSSGAGPTTCSGRVSSIVRRNRLDSWRRTRPEDSIQTAPTAKAATAAAAPRRIAARGPYSAATQPTIGAPMGVPPMRIAMYSASTRPRSAGSVVVCT